MRSGLFTVEGEGEISIVIAFRILLFRCSRKWVGTPSRLLEKCFGLCGKGVVESKRRGTLSGLYAFQIVEPSCYTAYRKSTAIASGGHCDAVFPPLVRAVKARVSAVPILPGCVVGGGE